MPGSGKSTFWKILAQKLWKQFIDFDDDIIEKSQWKSVWELVDTLEENNFLKLEETLCLWLSFHNSIFSTSWSLPYSQSSINHLKKLWTIIYIQVDIEEIIHRIWNMKTERIIGLQNNDYITLYKQREKLYQEAADIVFPYSWTNIEAISNNLIQKIWKY